MVHSYDSHMKRFHRTTRALDISSPLAPRDQTRCITQGGGRQRGG